MNENLLMTLLRALGSLRLAAALLILVLVAMGFATIAEKNQSTEYALANYYLSSWFIALLTIMCVNILAAVIVRYPFPKHKMGFIITHLGIILTLGGALMTYFLGVNGNITLAEGEQRSEFVLSGDQLNIYRGNTLISKIDLGEYGMGGFESEDNLSIEPIAFAENMAIEPLAYLPHSKPRSVVTNNAPRESHALHVKFILGAHEHEMWLFEDRKEVVDGLGATYVVAKDDIELGQLMSRKASGDGVSIGHVYVTISGNRYKLNVEECMDTPKSIEQTGYSIKVLRYMPQARVAAKGGVENVSDKPINPAIEVELTSDQSNEKRIAFAKYPNLGSMHGEEDPEIKVVFEASGASMPDSPIAIVQGPNGDLYGRFTLSRGQVVTAELPRQERVNTPISAVSLEVLQQFDRAMAGIEMVEPEGIVKNRVPAVQVRITAGENPPSELWLRKYRAMPVNIDGVSYNFAYLTKQADLGFTIRLNDFKKTTYPGTGAPRSFESNITIIDPSNGEEETRLIKMNHPTEYGGYTFFQSSYDQSRDAERSTLSVARDPGMNVAFAGYIVLIAGMIIVMLTRAQEHKLEMELLEAMDQGD